MLAVNEACVPEVNSIGADTIDRFVSWGTHLMVIDEGDGPIGLLVGMTQDTPYESLNFGWFARRFDRFAYVDRIALADAARGKGYGPALYDEFVAWAAEHDLPRVTAEVNTVPPNPRSHRFHEIYGFRPLEEVAPKGGDDYKVMMLEYTIG